MTRATASHPVTFRRPSISPRRRVPVAGVHERALSVTVDPGELTKAQELFASMPTEALPARGPIAPGSPMPLAPNPLFVGRGDELLQVARALRGGGETVALSQVVASTGLGGLGKTQLAVELVYRFGRYFSGGVYWLSFAS